MKRFGASVAVLAAVVASGLALAGTALGYSSRLASRAEAAAVRSDAEHTEPCGYAGHGNLTSMRIVAYSAGGVSFKWAAVGWTPAPKAQECVLVFLHAAGYYFDSHTTPKHAKVDWLPFTWGSSPFDNPSYDNSQWRTLDFSAGPPNWVELNRALVLPLYSS